MTRTFGVTAAARAAGCRTNAEITEYRDVFFPGEPLDSEVVS